MICPMASRCVPISSFPDFFRRFRFIVGHLSLIGLGGNVSLRTKRLRCSRVLTTQTTRGLSQKSRINLETARVD